MAATSTVATSEGAASAPAATTSRLDGLFNLLRGKDTGRAVRRLAAEQISDLVYVPEGVAGDDNDAATLTTDAHALLKRLQRLLLSSRAWDVRLCVGHALRRLAERVPVVSPRSRRRRQTGVAKRERDGGGQNGGASDDKRGTDRVHGELDGDERRSRQSLSPPSSTRSAEMTQNAQNTAERRGHEPRSRADHRGEPHEREEFVGLSFAELDVRSVLDAGAVLLSSSGSEYTAAQRDVSKQWAEMRRELLGGVAAAANGDIDVDVGVEERDLRGTNSNDDDGTNNNDDDGTDSTGASGRAPANSRAPPPPSPPLQSPPLSVRERALQRRRAKRQRTVEVHSAADAAAAAAAATTTTTTTATPNDADGVTAPDDDDNDDDDDDASALFDWVFAPLLNALSDALLAPAWERRHGASVGFRDVLRTQARAVSPAQLEDIAVRLFVVLAMDRFGDYAAQSVVAPVRETAAMALGSAVTELPADAARRLLQCLLQLVAYRSDWQVRHGGLLGVRYVLAVRRDMSSDLLESALPALANVLQSSDDDDDVRAVASEALIPVVSLARDDDAFIHRVVESLWSALADFDDLSACTASVVRLLGKIADDTGFVGGSLRTRLPRLLACMRHPWLDVRRAVLRLLHTVMQRADWQQQIGMSCSSGSGSDGDGDGSDGGGGATDAADALIHTLYAQQLLETEPDVDNDTDADEDEKDDDDNSDNKIDCEGSTTSVARVGATAQNDKTVSGEPSMRALARECWRAAMAAAARAPARIDRLLPLALDAASAGTLAEAEAMLQRSRLVCSGHLRAQHGQSSPRSARSYEEEDAAMRMRQRAAVAIGCALQRSPGRVDAALLPLFDAPSLVKRRLACSIARDLRAPSPTVLDKVREQAVLPRDAPYVELGHALGPTFLSDCRALIAAFGLTTTAGNANGTADERVSWLRTAVRDDPVDVARIVLPARSHITALCVGEWPTSRDSEHRSRGTNEERRRRVEALRENLLTALGRASHVQHSLESSLSAAAVDALVGVPCSTVDGRGTLLSLSSSPSAPPPSSSQSSKSSSTSSATSESSSPSSTSADMQDALERRSPLPAKVGPWLKPLMAVARAASTTGAGGVMLYVPDAAKEQTARALARLAFRLAPHREAHGKALDLVCKNLVTALLEREARAAASDEASAASGVDARAGVSGERLALRAFARRFGASLLHALPQLERELFPADVTIGEDDAGERRSSDDDDDERERATTRCFTTVRALSRHLSASLHGRVATLFAPLTASRHPHAAHTLGTLCSAMPAHGMRAVIRHLLPRLESTEDESTRVRASDALRCVVNGMGTHLIPYAALLLMPCMARMVDQCAAVRQSTSGTFAALLRLLPLEQGAPGSGDDADENVIGEFAQECAEAREFTGQLFGTERPRRYVLPVRIGDGVQLREYQQDGLDWLAFLHRYGLHGALCDDMGLGKTLMTLCMLVGDRHERRQQQQQQQQQQQKKVMMMMMAEERKKSAYADIDQKGEEAASADVSAARADHAQAGDDATDSTSAGVPSSPSSACAAATSVLPSLVVCPTTVVRHWHDEVQRFFPAHLAPAVMYAGTPAERRRMRDEFAAAAAAETPPALVVTSYEVVRSDIDFLASVHWSYCVLDEGHTIKNESSRVSVNVRSLRAAHRLMLTGTPIQNSVVELWSLFDFLMPGFLGDKRAFSDAYAKPIVAGRNPKCSDRARKAGEAAMATLHRQVLPFVLRRMKEEVLKELPPKVVQDHYCELSEVQRFLYDAFGSELKSDVFGDRFDGGGDGDGGGGDDDDNDGTTGDVGSEDGNDGTAGTDIDTDAAGDTAVARHSGVAHGSDNARSGTRHIFQALMYMRRLCSHPRLVLNAQHAQHTEAMRILRDSHLTLHSVQVSPKLLALQELLTESGIGTSSDDPSDGNGNRAATSAQSAATFPAAAPPPFNARSGNADDGGGSGQRARATASVRHPHRALVFAQLRDMLDIVESDLFRVHMPGVSYLRLDGGVEVGRRQAIVNRFNRDPTVDVLLLTTHVGGLGLNLTGADTVIFLEHDWNPTVDLQAMDRAHRIGQRRSVSVYRIVTRGTLEEKIMSIQRFKTHIAETVVNRDNASLASMTTDDMLSLFGVKTDARGGDGEDGGGGGRKNGYGASSARVAESADGDHVSSTAAGMASTRTARQISQLAAGDGGGGDDGAVDDEYGEEFRRTAEFVAALSKPRESKE